MTAVAHQVTPFLTSYEVMARYHISYTTLWRRTKDGSLPQPRINRNTRNKLWHIEGYVQRDKRQGALFPKSIQRAKLLIIV